METQNLSGKRMNKYNLAHLIWCVAAKYDCKIKMSNLGRRYKVNFGVEIETKVTSTIIEDIKSTLQDRGFIFDDIFLTNKKFTVYLYRNGYGLNATIWSR